MTPHVHSFARPLAALLVATMFAAPLGADAQNAMTGTQQSALYQRAVRNFDREVAQLASLRNHIPAREIVAVSVNGSTAGPGRRVPLSASPSSSRRAALADALNKATVADVDRNNGQSEDQSSLAEYLQHLRIDPATVVAVDVDTHVDRDNPHVTVFYRVQSSRRRTM